MTTLCARPLAQHGGLRPASALPLAGGALWFTHAKVFERGKPPHLADATDLPDALLARLCAARAPIAGLDPAQPAIMGILNVTPDSFSDGGLLDSAETAVRTARAMAEAGADIVDVGGESTRPGAQPVPPETETARVAPVIAGLRAEHPVAISIDTRNAQVAETALAAGADLVNDVSGLRHDPAMPGLCAARGVPVCVMHAQGDPQTMQVAPRYDDVVLDVYDALAARLDALEAAGIARGRVFVDPGIGFGKTHAHNLALLRDIGVFHGLGCQILLGVSRKGFIGQVGQAPRATDRFAGSAAVGLAALAQGVQVLRVHDVAETRQALRLWQAVRD
ncbi:MAG: dihydropteroate synthase [Rhodobacteraceae bacterium]|nr:dihydropteroate synthase [Paracoccaceae bacterium]